MLKTVVKKGSYQDSVVLMLLTNELSSLDGVNKIQVMMATPANKDIFKESGLTTDELMDATANDMVVVADVNNEAVLDAVMDKVEEFLKKQSTAAEGKKGSESVKSWDAALKKMSNANLAVISIPGAYAALEADRALDEGLSVFMFSDNVTIEDEKALKEKAHSKGLAVMGPDCGTGIIQGVPIAFTNNLAKGSIGIIGASGTGIKQLDPNYTTRGNLENNPNLPTFIMDGFEITLERGKLVAEHDNLTFFELEQSERDFCFTATGGFEQPAGHEVTIELDGKNPQHVGVLNAFAGAILRGEPLVANGTEGIRGLELSNAMHLSSWTDQTVTLPIDEALFLEKLNEHRKASKVKTEVTEATFDTSDSYGSKVSDNTDKGGVKA